MDLPLDTPQPREDLRLVSVVTLHNQPSAQREYS